MPGLQPELLGREKSENHRIIALIWLDLPESFRLSMALRIQIEFPDNCFRITSLERRIADRPELSYEHRRKGMTQNIVPEVELAPNVAIHPLESGRDNGELGQGKPPEPPIEIRLYFDRPAFVYL